MRQFILALCLLIPACAGSTPTVTDTAYGLNLEVVMKNEGGSPREPLRYQGSPGQTQRVLLRMSLASLVESRYALAATAAPILDLVVVVGQSYLGTEPGVIGYPIRFEQIRIADADGLDQASLAALNAELAPIAQTTATYEIDDRGITRKANVNTDPNASPRLLALLGNVRTMLLSVALPTEAIGVGARWEVDRLVDLGGLTVPQKVAYTLLARDQNLVRIGVVVRQSATAQEVALGSGLTLGLEAYEVSAVGSTLVDLKSFAPLGEIHGLSQMLGTLRRGTESEPFSLNSDLMVQVVPLPAAAPVQQESPAPPPVEGPVSMR